MTDRPTSEFEIPGMVSLAQGEGGLPRIVVTTGDLGAWSRARAEIYLNGANVTSYDAAGRPLLFCSRTSSFTPGKAIRGGVPVIFPWFGPHPADKKLPQHGFARSMEWSLAGAERLADGRAAITLTLDASEATRALWPHDFSLRYTVTVGRSLEMALMVINRSSNEFRFEEALHSYLCVSDVRLVEITGLENTAYIDKVDFLRRHRHGDHPLNLTGETDRVFVNTTAPCRVHDPVSGDIVIGKESSLSTVVWNPWETKAEALPDLAGNQWHGMLCVETANAGENGVILPAGQSHTMQATITPAS